MIAFALWFHSKSFSKIFKKSRIELSSVDKDDELSSVDKDDELSRVDNNDDNDLIFNWPQTLTLTLTLIIKRTIFSEG